MQLSRRRENRKTLHFGEKHLKHWILKILEMCEQGSAISLAIRHSVSMRFQDTRLRWLGVLALFVNANASQHTLRHLRHRTSTALPELQKGRHVVVNGLTHSVELNGQEAVVEGYDVASARYVLRMASGAYRKVRQEHVSASSNSNSALKTESPCAMEAGAGFTVGSQADLAECDCLNSVGSQELEPLEPFNWDDRWLESYKDQMYTLGIKSTTAKLAELAVGGIWGEFVSLFIGIFFPPPGHKQSLALLKIVQKWTEKYVGKQQAALVRDLAEASLDTAKNTLEKQYEPPSAELLAAVEAKNMILRGGSQIPENTSRAQGIPTYIAATSLAMSLRRQLYNLTLLRDTWPHPWQGSSRRADSIVKEMKEQCKHDSQELRSLLIEAGKQWRFSQFTFTFDESRRRTAAAQGRLRDKILDWTFVYYGQAGIDRSYGERTETQHQRYLFADELVPMIKPFLLLQRVVSGWESRALSRGPLPEKLTIGPWSSLYAGSRGNNAANPPWADQEVPGPRPKGNVLVTSGGTMRSDGRYDKTRAMMPRSTCGIDATYFHEGIAQFVAVNAKNESEVRLHDLHSPGAAELNGELGLVRCFSAATGRYTVELSDGASGCLGLQGGRHDQSISKHRS
ncbi:unnamed protein product [Symbiodinium microadriaticum]|nr:unnamed protein product [Symbiodinium microadriaticum]